MQMRTKLAIVTVIGAGALLIAALAVFIASRAADRLRPEFSTDGAN